MTRTACIVGGGISGLSAAYFALKKGFSVKLFESTSCLGGLAASFDFMGLTIEKYYHFICGGDRELMSLARELGIEGKIRFQLTRTAFFYEGKYYPFGTPLDLLRFSPISMLSRIKFGLSITRSKYSKDWERLDDMSAKEWLSLCIGEKAYRIIWRPLLEIKFGDHYESISAAWIWHRIHRVASSRRHPFSKEKLGYFEGGSQTLLSALEKKIEAMGGEIFLMSKVRTVRKNTNGIILFLDSGKQIISDRVVLAVPLPIAAEMMKEDSPEYARSLSSIDFIGVVCGIFRLKRRVTDAFWLNTNDSRIPGNGFIEYTNLNSLREISPDAIVYTPFYVPVEDEWFSKDEDSLRQAMFEMLNTVNPFLTESDVVGFKAFKSPHAQAICTVGFRNAVPSVTTPLKGLYLLDSTQVYPSDRALSALVGLARQTIDNEL